jgi:hypothetical protein
MNEPKILFRNFTYLTEGKLSLKIEWLYERWMNIHTQPREAQNV